MKKILCIEDAGDIRHVIKASLTDMDVVFAFTLAEAKDRLREKKFDLILLDLSLPDGDGLEVFAELHQSAGRQDTPIIVLTGKRGILPKAAAFSLGAEDFIEKPFDPSELKIRVEARIRRTETSRERSESLRVGDLILHFSDQKLQLADSENRIDLTQIEFRLLNTFARTPERVFSRDALIDSVWGKQFEITARTVDTHIAHLRKKIHISRVQIETIFGEGYRLKLP